MTFYGVEHSDYDRKHLFMIDKHTYYLSELEVVIFKNNKILVKDFEKHENFIKENTNNIIYIKYTSIDTFEEYFLNSKFHNLKDAAMFIDKSLMVYNSHKYYYIDGKRLSYDEWVKHPKKIKYDRKQKMKIIND
jgi:hypothetical protein